MKGIHKEGFKIIRNTVIILLALNAGVYFITSCVYVTAGLALASILFLLFVLRFFRIPNRQLGNDPGVLYAPADGNIVVVEKTNEPEYFKDERIQVSIFMSVWNVHINWFPFNGVVDYFKHHQGLYLIASKPKSSTENERTSVVLKNEKATVLFRQIAGYVARRIVCYAKEGTAVSQGNQMGFIKFGSRVDIFLPVGTELNVKVGDKVTGMKTIIAKL